MHPNRWLVPTLLVLTLTGAGCWKRSETAKTPTPSPKASSNPSVLLFPADGKPEPSINEELRQILTNFRNAKSFRTKFAMSPAQGKVSGLFEFARPNRMKGTLEIAQAGTADVVMVDESLYMRMNEGKWNNLTATAEGKATGETLKSAMNGSSDLSTFGISDEAMVRKSYDDSRGCDLYTTSAKGSDGNLGTLEICAINKFPRYLTMTGPQGPVTIEYYDFNANFIIEKPIK